MRAEINFDALAGQVSSYLLSKLPRHKTTVIAYHDLGAGVVAPKPSSSAVSNPTYIVKGEFFSNDGAPAVGTKANRTHDTKVRWG